MKITARQYAQTLFEMTDGKSKPEIEKFTANFSRYIYRNRKLNLASKIIEQFSLIYNKKRGIIEAEAISRKKLDEQELRKVKHYIKEKHQAEEVVLKNTVDEKIKGGIILKVGDEIVDGSISGRIRQLSQIIT